MDNQLPRTAIVTGGSGGIGEAIALRLADDGFAVVVGYAGRSDPAENTVQTINGQGGTAIAVQADVGNPQAVERLFNTSRDAFGRIDVVVNSAGVMPLTRISDGDLTAFDKVIETNLRGTFVLMAQAARELGAGGRIIALSSSVIAKAFAGYGPYIASKAGVEGLVPVLANELRGRDITVNAIAPGPVATPMFLEGKSDALIEQIATQAPMERIAQPQEVAAAAAFLAGPDGAWMNAQVLRVNGGFA